MVRSYGFKNVCGKHCIFNYSYMLRLACWVKISTDDILKNSPYFFP